MERGHMPGYLFSDGFDEFSYFFQLLVGIIQAGNNKRRYLDPDVCLFIKPDRVENRLKLCAADLFVKILGESLEVYIRRVEIRPYHLKGLRSDIPVRDEHVLEPSLDCQTRCVIGKLEIDRRLGIGVGNTGALGRLCRSHDLFRADSFAYDSAAAVPWKLRDVRILTVQTTEITARCCYRIGQAAGEEMKERLFLYGVDVLRDDLVVDERVEHAAPVLTHSADASPSVCDKTAMATQAALHLLIFFRLLEQRLLHNGDFLFKLLYRA